MQTARQKMIYDLGETPKTERGKRIGVYIDRIEAEATIVAVREALVRAHAGLAPYLTCPCFIDVLLLDQREGGGK